MHLPVRSLALTAPGDLAKIGRMTQALGAIATKHEMMRRAQRPPGRSQAPLLRALISAKFPTISLCRQGHRRD
jgi:hypothetical protein